MENKEEKQILIEEIKKQVEELLMTDIPEAQKEKLIGQALKIIKDGKDKGEIQ
jgi:hypothetical protein